MPVVRKFDKEIKRKPNSLYNDDYTNSYTNSYEGDGIFSNVLNLVKNTPIVETAKALGSIASAANQISQAAKSKKELEDLKKIQELRSKKINDHEVEKKKISESTKEKLEAFTNAKSGMGFRKI